MLGRAGTGRYATHSPDVAVVATSELTRGSFVGPTPLVSPAVTSSQQAFLQLSLNEPPVRLDPPARAPTFLSHGRVRASEMLTVMRSMAGTLASGCPSLCRLLAFIEPVTVRFVLDVEHLRAAWANNARRDDPAAG